jgi:hypothetical protein
VKFSASPANLILMKYQTMLKLVLASMLTISMLLVLLWPKSTTKWQGPLVVATVDAVTSTNKTLSIRVDEKIEVGLRSDGVVVWRNKE